MELTVIDTPQGVLDLIEYVKGFDYVAFDTETTGLSKRDEIIGMSVCCEDDKAFYVILQAYNPTTKSLDELPAQQYAAKLIDALKGKQLVMHNGVFDCMMVEAYYKVRLIDYLYHDTMIAAHLLNENRSVGLKSLAAEYYGDHAAEEARIVKQSVLDNGGSITKKNYEMWKADSKILGKYGAKDALLTYKLFLEFTLELHDQNLASFFYEEESMPLLRGPTYDLNTTGLEVDVNALTMLKNTLKAEAAENKAFIYNEIEKYTSRKYPKGKFNIGSSQQLSWLLFGELNLEFQTLTPAGKKVCKAMGLKLPYTRAAKKDFINECRIRVGEAYELGGTVNGKTVRPKLIAEPWKYIKCDKATLTKLAPKQKWIDKLLSYQKKMKLLSTYIEGVEERIQYGIIQPGFLQHGTTSGRYSSRNPNFQNLPRDDQRIKNCIVARPGKCFVGADYSQLEPRVFAYYSGDQRLKDAFNGETDFYSVIGMAIFDITDAVPLKEGPANAFGVKYKSLRQIAKVIALARAYGATAFQLAPMVGKSVEDTEELMQKYDENLPGVRVMMLEAHALAKKNGEVENLFGRKRRMPDAKNINKIYGPVDHKELPYEARSLLNLACNHRIQSTGASIINRAAINFYRLCKDANIDCKFALQVHDELIIECNEADAANVSDLLQFAMEHTNELPGVPLEAIPRITKTLAK